MVPLSDGALPPVSRLGVALIALVVAAHLAAVVATRGRTLHVDEAEYLHATWLMDQGKTIYRDFMQDHSPFLFQFMSLFDPREGGGMYPLLDIERFATTGRLLAGLCGAIVLIAAAALAQLTTRNALAALVALSYILREPVIWQRGLADLRSDPFSLAMLWGGILLIVMTYRHERRRHAALLAGSGIALVAAAALLNPKWPLESIVIGVVYLMTLWRLRARGWSQVFLSLLPTAIVLAGSAAMLLSVTTFAEYVYFTFQLKTAIQQHVLRADLYELARSSSRWWTVIGASDFVVLGGTMALLAASRRFEAVRQQVDAGRVAILFALCLASIAELPFYEPYTRMWPQYRVSWTIAIAILYGVVVAVLYGMLMSVFARRKPEQRNVLVVLFAIACGLLLQWILVLMLLQRASLAVRGILIFFVIAGWVPLVFAYLHASGRRAMRDANERLPLWSATLAAGALSLASLLFGTTVRDGWTERARIQAVLGRGETVWLGPQFHPIAAMDGSYFWYAFADVTPGALSQTMRSGSRLPRITERDLPPCRINAGLDPQTRFLELGPWLSVYPGMAHCVVALLDRNLLAATTHTTVFEVKRAGRPLAWDVPPRKAAFRLRRLRHLANRTIEDSERRGRPLPSAQ